MGDALGEAQRLGRSLRVGGRFLRSAFDDPFHVPLLHPLHDVGVDGLELGLVRCEFHDNVDRSGLAAEVGAGHLIGNAQLGQPYATGRAFRNRAFKHPGGVFAACRIAQRVRLAFHIHFHLLRSHAGNPVHGYPAHGPHGQGDVRDDLPAHLFHFVQNGLRQLAGGDGRRLGVLAVRHDVQQAALRAVRDGRQNLLVEIADADDGNRNVLIPQLMAHAVHHVFVHGFAVGQQDNPLAPGFGLQQLQRLLQAVAHVSGAGLLGQAVDGRQKAGAPGRGLERRIDAGLVVETDERQAIVVRQHVRFQDGRHGFYDQIQLVVPRSVGDPFAHGA